LKWAAAAAAVAPALLAGSRAALAVATDTWTGGGGDANWLTGGNWGGTAPSAGDNLIFTTNNNLITNDNFPNGTLFNSITFDASAGAFTLGGNSVLLGGSSAGSIINSSSNLQTISLGLTLSNLVSAAPFGGNHFINGGTSGIALNPSGGLLRTLGSTADFAGTLSTTTITNDSTGIIGGWAIFGSATSANGTTVGTDLAAVSGGQIVAYTGYNNITGTPAIASSPGTNYKWSGSGATATLATASGTTDFNSLTFSDSTATLLNMTATQTLRLGTTGTIFHTANADAVLTIGTAAVASTLTAGGPNPNTAGELIIDANSLNDPNPGININSVITDNGTGKVTLVKTGNGVCQLQSSAAVNSFTGDVYIDQGRLRAQNIGAFGKGSNVYVASGGQAYFNTADTITQNFFIAGKGLNEGTFFGGAIRLATNGVTLSGTVTLTDDATITARGAAAAGSTISGKITGAHNLEFNGAATTNQIISLTNPANDWSGNTTVSFGVLKVGANEVIPNGAGKGNVIINNTNTATPGSNLDLNGKTETINGLSAIASGSGDLNHDIVTDSVGTGTLNVGDTNATSQYDGIFTTTAGATLNVNKIGGGTLTLTNSTAGTFTGTATAAAGTLALASTAGFTANLASSGGASGGKLDLTAFNPTGFTLASGQTLSSNSSVAGGGVIGNVNVNSGSFIAGTGTIGGPADTVTLNGGGGIHPGSSGADGSVGTLTLSNLTVNGGDYRVDAQGAGDSVNVTGTATFGGASTITVAPGSAAGTYTIFTAGTLVDTTPPTLSQPSLGRANFSLDFSTANAIKLTVTGGAATLQWNNAGTGGGDGTTWDIQNNHNWANLTTPALSPDQYFEADNVTFNDSNNGNYTVNISGTVNPGSLTVNNSAGDYTFNGGSIAGPIALNKSGANALTLTNANSYTGGTNLNNGTLNLNNGNAIGSGALNINGGALGNTSGGAQTLATNNAVNVNASFAENGPGDLNLGTGAFTLNAANPTITVAAGTLTVGGIIGNGTSGTGFTKAGAGSMLLPVANTYTGATNINAGKITVGNFAALGPTASLGAVNIPAGGELEINSSITTNTAGGFGAKVFTIAGTGADGNGVIQNNGNNQQNAFQKVTLSNNATIGGTARFDIRGGTPVLTLGGFTLTKAGANQFSLVATTVGNGNISVQKGTLSIETTSTVQGTGTITYDATVNPGTPPIGQFFQNGAGKVTRPIVVNGAGIILGSGSTTLATIDSPITLQGDVTIEPTAGLATAPAANNPLTLNGSITESGGSHSLTKAGTSAGSTGPATLTLAGTNTYTGGTNIQYGTIKAASAGAIPSTGTVSFGDVGNDPATLDLNGNTVTVGGLANVGAGAASIGNSSTTAAATLMYTGGIGAVSSTFGGIISDVIGTGTKTTALTVSGGSLTLTAANTYTGNTNVSAGATLAVAATGSLAPTTNLTANGLAHFSDLAQTINTLNGAGSVSLDNGVTLTISNGGTFSGVISDDPGALTIAGGTMTLSGDNTYTGNTTVNTGATLNVTGSLASTNNVTANGSANFGAPGSTAAVTQQLASLSIAAASTSSVTLSMHAATPKTLQVGTLTFGDPSSPSSSTINITNNILIANGLDTDAEALITSHKVASTTAGLALGYKQLTTGPNTFEIRATLLGDSDLDGQVNVADLANLAGNFGKTIGQVWLNGDFDYNGNVNVADLADLAGNFGKDLTGAGFGSGGAASPAAVSAATSGSAAVPEPAGLSLFSAAAISLLLPRRRRRG
jgi:autotransporter-associated beta strand protein